MWYPVILSGTSVRCPEYEFCETQYIAADW